jgi:cysteine desulfurase
MIYLDNNATSPLLPGVLDAMLPYFGDRFGNGSSRHPKGIEARQAIETARFTIASFLGASAGEVYFTSCGTESVTLAFRSALTGGRPAVATAVEHSCVLDAADTWRSQGRQVVLLPVDADGVVDLQTLDETLRNLPPAFVSAIWVNNETGVISPVAEIATICQRHGALLHFDGVQAPTRVAVDLAGLGCDYASFSAHKFGGPKGVGILFVRSGALRVPLLAGHQESGLRAGTENTPALVGAATALDLQPQWRVEAARQAFLRDRLELGILERIPGAAVNGSGAERVGNTTSVYFPGRSAADMVAALGRTDVCVSAGAACSTGGQPSHVLRAMGHGEERSNGSLRFSLGASNSESEVLQTLAAVSAVYGAALTSWVVA